MKGLLTVIFPKFNFLALIVLKILVTTCGCERKCTMFSDDWVVYSKGTTGEECLGASAVFKCCTRSQKEIDLKDAVNGFTSLIDFPAELLLPEGSEVQVCTKGFSFLILSLNNLLASRMDT